MKLTQRQQDLRKTKAYQNLEKRILRAQKREQKEIDKAYTQYEREK